MRTKVWILVLLIGGIFVEILTGLNGYTTIRRLVTTNNWINHTRVILEKTEQIDTRLTHIDNDLRGHLLSQNPYFLADFNRNAKELRAQSADLKDFVKSPLQRQRFFRFHDLLEEKLALGKELFVRNEIAGGTPRLDSGRVYLDKTYALRTLLLEIQDSEETLLTQRVEESETSANEAVLSIILGTLVAIVVVLIAVSLLLRLLRTRKRLYKELKENEFRLKEVLDAVPAAVTVYDAQGNVFYTNQGVRTLLDNTPATYSEQIKALPVYRFPTGELYPVEDRPYAKALQGISSQVDDMELRLNGKRSLFLNSAHPIFDPDGKLLHVVLVSVDITDRLQSHTRLQEAKEMAEKVARMKENFLANMSHEIRTPLNSIIGFTTLLETSPLNPEQAEYLKAVNTASRNLLTIVNDILDISKIEAGMLQFEHIPFSINSLVQSIRIMLQPSVLDKQLVLNVQLDPGLPEVVLGDPTRLTQILLNLASNAVKFTEKGRIDISIHQIQQAGKHMWVRLEVKDTGIGIPSEVLPHIFERFRQESTFTTRQYGGSGLGLNIVHSLVEMLGGRISVESTPGAGSRFVVDIPYEVSELDKTEELLPLISSFDGHQSISVLVVEDNPMNQKLATAVLGRMGYSSDIAENGVKALEKLAENRYDLILMDIQMPVMDGYETTREIRNTLKLNIPIVAMTAHALVGEREHCLKVGMNDFVSKPFQMADLYRIVRRQLQITTPGIVVSTASQPAEEVPALKLDYLHEVTGGDEEAMADLLSVYLEESPRQLQKFRKAIEQLDVPEVGKIAHALKSPAQMIGADHIVPLFIRLQEMANRDGMDIGSLEPLVDEATQKMNLLFPLVEEARNTLLGSGR